MEVPMATARITTLTAQHVSLAPVHQAQILSYLKLCGKSLGLLINFNVVHLKDGIKRFVNGTGWK
jgi:GxxExxY protein